MSSGLPRVLVLTGTSDHPFPRLLDALPRLVLEGAAGEVRVQSRFPPPQAPGVVHLGMLPRNDLQRELAQAEVVVTHGGSGSCMDAIRAGHVPIIVPRRSARCEHVDDHQLDVAAALEEKGLARSIVSDLPDALPSAVRAHPRRSKPGRSPNSAVGARLRALLPDSERTIRGQPRAPLGPAAWTTVDGEEAWNAVLSSTGCRSALQSWAWGEASRTAGRIPLRRVLRAPDGSPLASIQALQLGSLTGMRLVWAPGGPNVPGGIDTPPFRNALHALARRHPFGRFAVVAASPAVPWEPAARDVLTAAGFAPVGPRPPETILLPLNAGPESLRRGLTKNWRHNLSRSERRGLEIREITGPQELEAVHGLYGEVLRKKGLPSRLTTAFLAALYEAGRSSGSIRIFLAFNAGSPTAARVVGWGPGLVHDLFAGADEAARHTYANYALVWHIIEQACAAGLDAYDLGGIDPIGNPGVFDFKRGLGGRRMLQPGAWVHGVPEALLRVGRVAWTWERRSSGKSRQSAVPTRTATDSPP